MFIAFNSQSLAFTSISLRDLPRLYDIIGGSLYIDLTKKRLVRFSISCQCFIRMFLRLASNSNFKERLIDRGYPQTMIENLLSDTKFIERESALLKHNNKEEKEILPFVTQYQPSVSTLKEVLMKKWNLIQN